MIADDILAQLPKNQANQFRQDLARSVIVKVQNVADYSVIVKVQNVADYAVDPMTTVAP